MKMGVRERSSTLRIQHLQALILWHPELRESLGAVGEGLGIDIDTPGVVSSLTQPQNQRAAAAPPIEDSEVSLRYAEARSAGLDSPDHLRVGPIRFVLGCG